MNLNFSFIPDYSLKKLTDITPEFLSENNIKLLMLDMDNTIAPYDMSVPDSKLLEWSDSIKAAGTELFIVSNSKRVGRTEKFAQKMNIGFIKAAGKPSPNAIYKVIGTKSLNPDECALVGDQIFTDTIAANLAGVMSVIVYPIKFTNIFLRLRYWAEIPFRSMCKNRRY